jgi:hypothetical protein
MAGDVTGGELYHLWRVSEVHLPRIADIYYDANRLVAGAATGSEGGFGLNAPAYPGSSVMVSAIGAAWAQLRDELQEMYAQIGGTVLEAAAGVRLGTQAIIAADADGSNELEKFLRDPNQHTSHPESNPPVGDDVPRDPILPR